MAERIFINRNNKNNKWFGSDGSYVCGYAYANGTFIEKTELIQYFSDVKNDDDFKRKITELNGIFTIILVIGEKIMAAVDRYGVAKLYYCAANKNIYIGDNAGKISNAAGKTTINKKAEKDWLYAGFVAKNETLLEGIMSLNASEKLFFNAENGSLIIERYHEFRQKPESSSYTEYKERLRSVWNTVAKRFISSLDGKKVLIPLSGGVDSRLGALMLKEAGYKNVLCFTYGRKRGKEAKIARRVAEEYGFMHIFIPYKIKDWFGLFRNKECLEYIEYSAQYKAAPHFTDLFAARHLAKLVNPDECIVVPGHIGSIAESLMAPGNFYSKDEICHLMIKKYFYYYGLKYQEAENYLKERLMSYFGTEEKYEASSAQDLFDNAAYDTYRSNHLFMAIRPYEFYGFKWRLPIMDNNLVDFFEKIPLKYKAKAKILLSDFITGAYGNDPGLYIEPSTYLTKVARNLLDKRYYCINPFNVFKLRNSEHALPGIHRVLYRYYRNYLCYTAARTLRYILDGK